VSYTKQFSKRELTKVEREAEALKATFEWLSQKQVNALREWALAEHASLKMMYRQLRLALDIAGVRGYWPARAVLRWMLNLKKKG